LICIWDKNLFSRATARIETKGFIEPSSPYIYRSPSLDKATDIYFNCHFLAFSITVTIFDSLFTHPFFIYQIRILLRTISEDYDFTSWNRLLNDFPFICNIIGTIVVKSFDIDAANLLQVLQRSQGDQYPLPLQFMENILSEHFNSQSAQPQHNP